MYREKICQIIPTKDRPQEMRRLLESIRSQSCRFDQIIVVDASDNPIKSLLDDFSDLNITYIQKYPPSLIPQRNAGLAAVASGITLVGFLDDDIILEPGCIEAMYDFWDAAGEEIGGAEYNITFDSSSGAQSKKADWVRKKFLLQDNSRKGQILPSGLGISPYPAEHTMGVNWLSGGCNVYRRHIFERFKFDDWYIGWGIGDDLEFSYRVSQEYQLFVVAAARLQHLPLPVKRGKNYLCGKMLTLNHFHFVRKNPEFSTWWCVWANLGRALIQFYIGISSLDLGSLQRSAGNLAGICRGLAGSLQPMNEIVK